VERTRHGAGRKDRSQAKTFGLGEIALVYAVREYDSEPDQTHDCLHSRSQPSDRLDDKVVASTYNNPCDQHEPVGLVLFTRTTAFVYLGDRMDMCAVESRINDICISSEAIRPER
jgi:hypothetical protein